MDDGDDCLRPENWSLGQELTQVKRERDGNRLFLDGVDNDPWPEQVIPGLQERKDADRCRSVAT